MRVVLIHGRAEAMAVPATMLREWEAALRFGLERAGSKIPAAEIDVRLAFYGSVWRPDERQPLPEIEHGPAVPQLAIPGLSDLSLWVDQKLGVGDTLLELLLRDVDDYYAEPELRQLTNARLVATCRDGLRPGERLVVIGFSMGSLVAYDTLRADRTLPVAALITCGSPLAMPSIYRRVQATAPRGLKPPTPFPPQLHLWVNVWTKDDPGTAGHHDMAARFPAPDPNAQRVQDLETWGRSASPPPLPARTTPSTTWAPACSAPRSTRPCGPPDAWPGSIVPEPAPNGAPPPPHTARIETGGSRRPAVAALLVVAVVAVAVVKPWGGSSTALRVEATASPSAPPPTAAIMPRPDPLASLPSAGRVIDLLAPYVRAGDAPGTVTAMASDARSLWTWDGRDGLVARLDPATGSMTTTRLGAPQDVARYGFESAGIASGGSGVWAVDAAHRGIARIDPASGAVAQRVALPSAARDPSSIGLATAFGIGVVGTDVWIPRVRAACVVTQRMMDCSGLGDLLRLDTTRRGRVVSRIPVVNPQDVLVAFDSVWLVASDPRTGHDIVTRFDPATSHVIATVALPGPSVGDCLGACAPLRARASEDSIWVSAADSGALVRIDPGTNRVAATVFFSRALTGVAVGGDGTIWVTAWDPAGPSCDGFVARVDPLALAPVAATPMECPRTVDVAGGDVWVAGRDGVSRLHPAP